MSATLLFVQTVLRLNELVMWRWFLFSVDVKLLLLRTDPLYLCRPRSQHYATHLARSVFILVLTAFSTLTSLVTAALDSIHRVSKRTVQNCFCQNFVKLPPILIIFGRMMTKKPKLCKVRSFSTSPNSRHHTTLLNADVQIVTQHRNY